MTPKILFLLVAICTPIWAEPPQGEAPPPIEIVGKKEPEKVFLHKRRPPPVEAVEACQNKKRNASCNFLGLRGEEAVRITGYCWTPEPSLPLACRPDEPDAQRKAKPKSNPE